MFNACGRDRNSNMGHKSAACGQTGKNFWADGKIRVVPVLDLRGGLVVHGRGGRRETYLPVRGRLTTSADPLSVATAFRATLGLDELYVADLDALAGRPAALTTFAALSAAGFRLWIDAGVRTPADAEALLQYADRVVLGLETVPDPATLRACCRSLGDRAVASLDLRDGRPLHHGWGEDVRTAGRAAVDAGARRLLVLDLARVGSGAGTGTESLLADLAASYPEVELSAGGGVRDAADLERLRSLGVRAALVASALHDGRIGKAEVEALRETPAGESPRSADRP